MKKKNKLVLTISLIVLLLTVIVGTAYAYYTANVTTAGTASQVEAKTTVLVDAQMNLGSTITSNNAFPGHKEMKELTITGSCRVDKCEPTNAKIEINANIDAAFKTDVVYKLYKVDNTFNVTKCVNTKHDKNNEYYETVSECTLPEDAEEVVDLTGSTSGYKYHSVVVNQDTNDKYILVAEYVNNPSENQTAQGKVFKISMDFITSINPEISLAGVPDVINKDNYQLPTYYKVYDEDAVVKCTTNSNTTTITNTSDLTVGENVVTCSIVKGTEILASTTKIITKSYEIASGTSIYSILEENDLDSGYYNFNVDDQTYPVHLYTLNGNQTFTGLNQFGDSGDVATADEYAKNMVIVKVNGDLTIESGATLLPYYTEYGGPKGFTVYVTGTLTNNGTIDNSHGAKAEGQPVYLYSDVNGYDNYTVPASGGAGGKGLTGRGNGNKGQDGTEISLRALAGGGSGGSYSGSSGLGGNATSYSGGSGGGANGSTGSAPLTSYGSNTGGSGGNGFGTTRGNSGGAGNPGGTGSRNSGLNGTGGLLTIYSDNFVNNNTITANGYSGGASSSDGASGGSSGGGSINIFTKKTITIKGIITANGGASSNGYKGGAGGTGTVTYTQIS